MILPTKWAYLGRAKNCHWGHAIYGGPQASLEKKRRENSSVEEKGELGGAILNRIH